MKTQIATNPEQSKRLLACGVDPNTADMSYVRYTSLKEDALSTIPYKMQYMPNKQPAWSLSALLSLLPMEIKEDNDPYDEISTYGLLVYPYMQGWQIDYQYCEDDECHSLKCVHGSDLIEACVKAIEYLTANGYTLNTK